MALDDLTYAPVGATRARAGAAWARAGVPQGYRVLHVRHRVARGGGETARAALADDLRTWRVHREAGVRLRVAGPATPGARVVTLLGRGPATLHAPCRVVWVDDQGFGYGTLPGHPVEGEEAFRAVLRDGDVWLEVEAYSRLAWAWARVLGPVMPIGQRLYVRVLARAARRLHRRRA
jgi:uncharacterized protein (UPF0548 family)